MRLILFLLFYSVSTFAFNPYLRKGIDEHPVCGNTYLELKNLPPVRDQGAYGTCYAHSSMLLLEYLRCSKSQNAQACYSEQGSIPHLARFNSSGNLKMIPIGGFPKTLLNNFKSERKLSKENCASYSVWNNLDSNYREEREKLKVPESELSEVDYFYYISRKLKDIRVTREEKSCWAQEIVDAGMGDNVDDILRVLNDSGNLTWQQLRYKILVPDRCTKDLLSYPEYTVASYPSSYGEKKPKRELEIIYIRPLRRAILQR